MSLTKSDDYTKDWLMRTASGVAPIATLVIAIVLFTMGINAVKYYRYKLIKLKNKKKPILHGEQGAFHDKL